MAQETKRCASPNEGCLRDILVVLEKKIRNLEKRKARLESFEKEIELGNELTKNQEQALEKKDQVLDTLEMCRDFLTQAEEFAKNDDARAELKEKKLQKEQGVKVVDAVGNIMRLQFLLKEGLRREDVEDNDVLEALQLSSNEAQAKDAKSCARLWLNVLECRTKEFAPGFTFAAAHDRLKSIGEFLDQMTKFCLTEGSLPNAATAAPAPEVTTSQPQQQKKKERQPRAPKKQLPTKQADSYLEKPTNNHEDSLCISPAEDSILNSEIDAEQQHAAQNSHPPAPQQVAVPVSVEFPPSCYPISSITSSEELQNDDDALPIQFGSVISPVMASHLDDNPSTPSPNGLFENREFDFLQDDLTAPAAPALHSPPLHSVVQDPAVVCASVEGQYNAHYRQMLQIHQQQMSQTAPSDDVQQQQMNNKTNIKTQNLQTELSAEKQSPNNDYKGQVPRDNRRSPHNETNGNRGNHHGNHRGTMNGKSSYGGGWASGRNWTRGGGGEGRNNYNNASYGHNNRNNNRNNSNGGLGGRRDNNNVPQTAQRV